MGENSSGSSAAPLPCRPFAFSGARLPVSGPLARQVSRLPHSRVRLVHWPETGSRAPEKANGRHGSGAAEEPEEFSPIVVALDCKRPSFGLSEKWIMRRLDK